MAGFLNKFMNKFSEFDEEEYDYNSEYIDDELEEEESLETEPSQYNDQQPRVVNFRDNLAQQVVVVKPDSMESAQEISNHLRAGRTIICNFEQVDQKVAQRVVDFMTGSAYALDGHVQPVSALIFVIVPRHVTLMNPAEQKRNAEYAYRTAYGL